jgi:uncharacterized Ntn-hydrolase superfamily protein
MTFSIVARCAETGTFGVAICSSSPAVAARCAHAAAGVGAVASQNVTDPRLGPRGLALMTEGASAAEAIAILARTGAHIEYRQVLAVDGQGGSAAHTGAKALGTFAHAVGPDAACGGNLLASEQIPQIMLGAFQASTGPLGDRLIAVLRAARDAGGEEGPVHSAGLKLVRDVPWPVADLRVDWTEGCPVEALASLWALYSPQLEAYVQRALDPTGAPKFGVPGDE